MKNDIYKSLKILTLALLIGVGTSVAFGAWNHATNNPPEDNSLPPINESSTLQTKSGNLNAVNDYHEGTISADMLSVFGTSYFGDDIAIGDEAEGTPAIDMHVTGKVGVNLDDGAIAMPDINRTLDVHGTGRFYDLALDAHAGTTYPAHACVATDGTLVVCPPPPPFTPSISGPTVTNQVYIPQGGGTENCSADVSFSATATGGDWPYAYSWRAKHVSGGSNTQINWTTAPDNTWISVGNGTSTTFHVFMKNPGDSWSIELTGIDDSATTNVVTQPFDVWTITPCAD